MPRILLLPLTFGLVTGPGARAAGLDQPDVGGLWGTAATTNPSAVWWNPAGLAAEQGTRYLIDIGPSVRRLTIDANAPGRTGPETFTDTLAVPFVGLASNFGEKQIGFGFGLFVPYSQRLRSSEVDGPNRLAARATSLRVLQLALGGAWTVPKEWLSIGVSASVVDGRHGWTVDVPTVRAFASELPPGTVDDDDFADPDYAATVTHDLGDQATTFGVGVYLRPLADERRAELAVSVAYLHRLTLDNTGTTTFDFRCPPPADAQARAVAERQGICDARVDALGTVTVRLPSRVHLGVLWRPVQRLRLEAFGSWVGWSRSQDVRVATTVDGRAVDAEAGEAEATATRWTLARDWARDATDVVSATLDAKIDVTQRFTMGARVGFEQASVPTASLSAIHADSHTLRLAGMGVFQPYRALQLGISYGRDLAQMREVDVSAFGLSLAEDRPDRYRYADASGRYAFFAQRVGFVLRGVLGPATPSFNR